MTDVWNTIENMRRLETSVNSFFEVLEREVESQGPLTGTEPNDAGGKYTDKGWCYLAEYRRYRLKWPAPDTGRSRFFGNLTVGVELWRKIDKPSDAWCYARESLIYVGFSPGSSPNNYWDKEMALDYRGTPLPSMEGDQIVEPTERAPWLWLWGGDNPEEQRWDKRNWFFVLRLFDIDSTEAVLFEIIEPLRNLLVDKCPSREALANRKSVRRRSNTMLADPPD